MIRLARELRLVPVVLIATVCLFALKTLGLILDGGYTFAPFQQDPVATTAQLDGTTPVAAPPNARLTPTTIELQPSTSPAGKRSWAQEMFNFPETTGSVAETKPETKPAPVNPPPSPGGTVVPLDRSTSPAERAILERLHERRQELDTRARELEIRESLLKAAEKRIEGRMGELKEIEGRVTAAVQKRDEVESGQLKSLVTMYENMRAKDAAKIFDRLELKILVDVTTRMNPRRMSDILAQMTPEAAERLTVELANRAMLGAAGTELPKIEGRPSGS
jgi:flagellar motility protein MotE (MotC chaperone)